MENELERKKYLLMRLNFIKENFYLDGAKVNLYPYQEKFLLDDSKFRIVNKSRQIGFTWIISAEAVADCMLKMNHTVLFVSTSQRASRNIMEYVKKMIEFFNPELKRSLTLDEETKDAIRFRNGSRIFSLPSSPSTIIGFRAHAVYFDEFSHMTIEKDLDRQIWSSLMPSISRGGTATIVSTPFGNLNMFAEIWTNFGEKYNEWNRHEIPWQYCPHLDIKSIKESMSEEMFRQEYNCEFIDESSSAMPYQIIMPCVVDGLLEEPFDNRYPVYIGIDLGKKQDSTVICAVQKIANTEYSKEQILKVIYLKELEPRYELIFGKKELVSTYAGQISEILKTVKYYQPVKIYMDRTGVGEKIYETLFSELGGRVEGITFTIGIKEIMFGELKLAFENKSIRIPRDQKFIEQLHRLKKVYSEKSNRVRYVHNPNEHDDMIWGCSLAVHASKQSNISWRVK